MSVLYLLATPAAAHVPVQPVAASVSGLRIPSEPGAAPQPRCWRWAVWSSAGWRTRSAGRIGNGIGKGAIAALVAGLIAVVNGGLVVVTADGGLGTGNGIAGGDVALVLGLIAVVLGGLARTRSRRAG